MIRCSCSRAIFPRCIGCFASAPGIERAGARSLGTRYHSKTGSQQAMLHVNVNPALLGGVIVKVGDTVMDGLVRKRLATLKTRILTGAA